MSLVNGTVSNIEFGACQVTFGGTDLGFFSGGVEFVYEVDFLDIEVDQSSMVVDRKVAKERCRATVNMAETDLTTLQQVFPSGNYTLATTKKKITVGGSQVDSSTDAKELVITPTTDGAGTISTDANAKITIHKAMPNIQFAKSFNRDGIRVVPVEFVGLRDSTKAAGNQLFLLGDSTAA